MTQTRKTLFLSASDVSGLIAHVGLATFIEALADRIRNDFIRWPEFQKCSRTANHSVDGVIELMPASDGDRFAFKYVNGHPTNIHVGLPTIMAYGGLSEVGTGWPLMVSEMTLLTAVRTAATSVVAAQVLAKTGSKSMAMIGNGAQSEFQVFAFNELVGVDRVHLYDIDSTATAKLMANLAGISGLKLVPHPSVASAVAGCDIVTTSTADKTRAQILTKAMIEPGMHLNAIGGDCPGKTELQADILENATVFVEYEPQSRVEGEIQQMPNTFPVTELWQVLRGCEPGRTSRSEVTVFDSVGFSIEDFSALNLTYELARANQIGIDIDLVPALSNTKDLYGHFSASGVRP